MLSSSGAPSSQPGVGVGCHIFVDESKSSGYIAAATYVRAANIAVARKAIASLRVRGAERLHFTHERDEHKKQVLDRMAASGLVMVRLYIAETNDHQRGREKTLTSLVTDALNAGAHRLVLEQDDSVLTADRRLLTPLIRRSGSQLQFEHVRAKSEPLLWVSDAVAWCWQRGERWVKQADPLIDTVQIVG